MQYQSQRPDVAVDLIRQALKVYEENAAAHVNLGLALQSLDQNEEARASFERATTIDPSNVGAWLGLGNVLTRLARNDPARRNDAIASFERVIALQRDHTFALHQTGVLHLERGDVEDALRSFDAALRIKPDLAEAWNNRGNALVTLGRREEAIASFNRALAVQPDLHFALQNRGILRAYLGDAHGALQDFDAALDQQNMTAQGYCGRGSALLQLQRFTDALSSFQQALSDEPENVEARLGQARSLSSLKRYSEALEVLESAVRIAPRNSEVLTDSLATLRFQIPARFPPRIPSPCACQVLSIPSLLLSVGDSQVRRHLQIRIDDRMKEQYARYCIRSVQSKSAAQAVEGVVCSLDTRQCRRHH